MESKRLAGKVIIVTGGTGILGHAFNEALAREGASLGILGRNKEVAEARACAINTAGGNALALQADVLDENQLKNASAMMLEKFGRIDGLVNAAGGNMVDAVVQNGNDIFHLNLAALREVMELNVFGTLLPTQVFGKAMVESAGEGSIVNISSVAAHQALSKVLGYSMAKAAIEGYTKWFAVEMANRYADKLRMNALVPGFFLTEQNKTLLTREDGGYTERGQDVVRNTPFKRFGRPEELTGALVWLLSNESVFVNGTSIVVDGGFLVNSGV
ncbi:MAG: SDR family oxidoreductase [Chitinophagaceae bacterium]|nr:SDR family oxidoreductase [Chitinophagaceae bacterium]